MSNYKKAYQQGYKARTNKKKRGDNPYSKKKDPERWGGWDDGWKDGEAEYETGEFDVRSDKSSLRQCDDCT